MSKKEYKIEPFKQEDEAPEGKDGECTGEDK